MVLERKTLVTPPHAGPLPLPVPMVRITIVSGLLPGLRKTFRLPIPRLVSTMQPTATIVVLILLRSCGNRVVLTLPNRKRPGPLMILVGAVPNFMLLPSPSSFVCRRSVKLWLLPAGLPGTVTMVLLGKVLISPHPLSQTFTCTRTAPLTGIKLALPRPPKPLRNGPRRQSIKLTLLLVRVPLGATQLENLMIPTRTFRPLVLPVMVLMILVRGFVAVLTPTLPLAPLVSRLPLFRLL